MDAATLPAGAPDSRLDGGSPAAPRMSAVSHDRQRTRVWVPLVSAVLLLVLGAAVAAGVGAGLGLSFTPLPAAPATPAPGPVAPMAAAPAIRSIAVPSGHRYE